MKKLIGPAEAPTVDVEIPTPTGPLQVRLPRLDFIDGDLVAEVDDELAEKYKEIEARRKAEIEAGNIVWEADRDLRFPNDLEAMQLLLEKVCPDEAAQIATAAVGVRRQLWAYWEEASKGDLGKSAPSAPSLPRKRAPKKR